MQIYAEPKRVFPLLIGFFLWVGIMVCALRSMTKIQSLGLFLVLDGQKIEQNS